MTNANNFYNNVSAVNWFDSEGKLHIRVYASNGNRVTERCSDQGNSGWTTGAFSQPGDLSAATAWTTSAGVSIRVYVINGGAITEWCADPSQSGWYKGAYTSS